MLGVILSIFLKLALAFSFPADYQLSLNSNFQNPSQSFRAEVSHQMKELNFISLLSSAHRKSEAMLSDQIYLDFQTQRSVALIQGIKVSEKFQDRIYKFNSLFFYHGDDFIFVFTDFKSRADVERLLAQLDLKVLPRQQSLMSLVVSSAHAAGSICKKMPAPDIKFLESAKAIEAAISECGNLIFQNAKDSLMQLKSTVDLIVTDPRKFLEKVGAQALELKSFVMTIHLKVFSLFKNSHEFSGPEVKTIACSLLGNLAPKIITGLSGVGLAKALPEILQMISKTESALKKFTELKKAGLRIPNRDKVITKVVSCGI